MSGGCRLFDLDALRFSSLDRGRDLRAFLNGCFFNDGTGRFLNDPNGPFDGGINRKNPGLAA